MQELNQILFLLFALILAAIFISTFVDKDQHSEMFSSLHWRWAILTRVMAYLSWALAPIVGAGLLTLANFSMMSSGLLLVLLYRSWRVEVSKSIEIFYLAVVVILTIMFEVLRQQGATYEKRVMLVGPVSILTSFLACYELLRYQVENKSSTLKILIAVVLGQVIMTTILVAQVFTRSQDGVSGFIQTRAQLELWGTVSAHLLSFILTSSFLYQQLFISKRKTYLALQEKRLELDHSTKEKEEITHLLAEREELIQSLIHANKTALTGALSASVAHEINQPIGAIKLNVEYLKRKLEKDAPDLAIVRDVIINIDQDSDRIAVIISSMQKIFRQEDIQAVDVNLNDLVLSLSDVFKLKIKNKNVELNFDLQAEALVTLNQEAFQQVILNLINNAIDAVSSLNQPERKILIETRNASRSVELIISDNGPGVSEDRKQEMFSLVRSNKEKGLGLGLWLSFYIVNRHAGSIRCEDNPEGGARFIISLPASERYLASQL